MIRGVNRYTVEVSRTGSPYFERAICFVRPEFAQCGQLDLHRAAKQLVYALDEELEERTEGENEEGSQGRVPFGAMPRWAVMAVSGIAGALLSFAASWLMMH